MRRTPSLYARKVWAEKDDKRVERSSLTSSADAPRLDHMTSALSFDHLLPEGANAYGFQTVGVAYATVARRCIIGDEMGLGKTIQALLTLEATGALDRGQAVVVCPASLKGNWVREVEKWLPGRTAQFVSGRKPHAVPEANVLVVNYDILKFWEPTLAPVALVLDESHYCKEIKAQRTNAALKLAQRVPAEGVVLLLTGTPLLNRPIELLSQLQILGLLETVVGKGFWKDDFEFGFKFSFCRNEETKAKTGKYTWDSAVDTARLNTRLREVGYVRRLRRDVLGMNDTNRIEVSLSLNGALDAYRSAEADIIAFLKTEKGNAAANRARQAETLVRLNTLRLLAGQAKIEAAVEWVRNFFASNPEKSLVIFAAHIEVQKALVAALADLNPAQILGSQKDVEAQKARFQAGDTKIIVCSIKAAREGHTLTAAHDVLFVEEGWNPGTNQQAEDRTNRIGQLAAQCVAWYLLASETIDEDIHALVEKKRVTVTAVADGEEAAAEIEIQAEVLKRLLARSN